MLPLGWCNGSAFPIMLLKISKLLLEVVHSTNLKEKIGKERGKSKAKKLCIG